VPAADLPRAFNRQPIWKRAAILAAGPGFNMVFAVLAYWIVFMAGNPGLKAVVGAVQTGSAAARAGIVKQDQIVGVNGRDTPTWEAVRLAMLDGVVKNRPLVLCVTGPQGAKRAVTVRYDDAGALTRPGDLLSGLGVKPWLPPVPPVIARVTPDSPAAHAGLRPGDRIRAVNGNAVNDWRELTQIIRAHPGQRLELSVERNGRATRTRVVPESRQSGGKAVGHIGAAVAQPHDYASGLRAEMRFGPLRALGAAGSRTGEVTALTAIMFYRMASGQASLANLSGPVDIAHYAGAWARAGFVPFLFFLALISISLALVNLLPIPLLDGGQLLYLAIEFVRRRPLSEHAEAIGQRVGLSLIALLVGFALFNDLRRLIH